MLSFLAQIPKHTKIDASWHDVSGSDARLPCAIQTQRIIWESGRFASHACTECAHQHTEHATIGVAILICSSERVRTAIDAAKIFSMHSNDGARDRNSRLLDLHIFSVCSAEEEVLTQLQALGQVQLTGALWLHKVRCLAATPRSSADSDVQQQKLLKAREDMHSVFVTMYQDFRYEFAAFVEDDLGVSPALPLFFEAVAVPTMRMDQSLFCASGWNDNAFGGNSAPPVILRGQHFMGLGWLMPRSRFDADVWPLWTQRWLQTHSATASEAWDQLVQRAMPLSTECLFPTTALTRHLRKPSSKTISQGSSMQDTFDAMSFWQSTQLGWPLVRFRTATVGSPVDAYDESTAVTALTKPHYFDYLNNVTRGAKVTCVLASSRDDAIWDRALHKISPRLIGVGNGGVPRGYHDGTVFVNVEGVAHWLVAVNSPHFSNVTGCSKIELPPKRKTELHTGQCISSASGHALIDSHGGQFSLQFEPNNWTHGVLSLRTCGGKGSGGLRRDSPKYVWASDNAEQRDRRGVARKLCLSDTGQLAVWILTDGRIADDSLDAEMINSINVGAWTLEAEIYAPFATHEIMSSQKPNAVAAGAGDNPRLVMQTDGVLVLYSASGEALWASNFESNPRIICRECSSCVVCAEQAERACKGR